MRSRSRNMYISGVCQAPASLTNPPFAIEWLAMRCSSAKITRRYEARSGTSTPARRSTARQ